MKLFLHCAPAFGALLCLAASGATSAPSPPAPEAVAPLQSADTAQLSAFRAECLSKAKAAEQANSMTVAGRQGWLFLAPELRHVGVGRFWGEAAAKASQSSRPQDADPLPAILDFKAQLDRAGIELLLVPVPPKAVIFQDKISAKIAGDNSAPLRFDLAHQEFYDLLQQKGVAVLDLTPEFLSHRADVDPIYCKQDTHWSGRGCVLAARAIARAIADLPWLQATPKLKLAQSWKRLAIEGDLRQGLGARAGKRETLPLRFVGTPASTYSAWQAPLKPVAPDRNSPVLLLGDSHNLIFHAGGDMHARGAGLPDQLAMELGFAVDLIAVRGSGATPSRSTLMRRARANASYLGRKKLVIWCLSAREFTQSLGWRKLPIVP